VGDAVFGLIQVCRVRPRPPIPGRFELAPTPASRESEKPPTELQNFPRRVPWRGPRLFCRLLAVRPAQWPTLPV